MCSDALVVDEDAIEDGLAVGQHRTHIGHTQLTGARKLDVLSTSGRAQRRQVMCMRTVRDVGETRESDVVANTPVDAHVKSPCSDEGTSRGRAPARRTLAGRASEAVRVSGDLACARRRDVDVEDGCAPLFERDLEHLIEVAVEEAAIVPDG
jgi:hypothetical protein